MIRILIFLLSALVTSNVFCAEIMHWKSKNLSSYSYTYIELQDGHAYVNVDFWSGSEKQTGSKNQCSEPYSYTSASLWLSIWDSNYQTLLHDINIWVPNMEEYVTISNNLKYSAGEAMDVCGWDWATEQEVCGSFGAESFGQGKNIVEKYKDVSEWNCMEYSWHSVAPSRMSVGTITAELYDATGLIFEGTLTAQGGITAGKYISHQKPIPNCNP